MPRMTVTLSESRWRAVKEAAARTGKTIGQILDESLDFAGIKSTDDARQLVAQARRNAGLREQAALDVAIEATRQVRRE